MKQFRSLGAVLFLTIAMTVSAGCCNKWQHRHSVHLPFSVTSHRFVDSPCRDACLSQARDLIRAADRRDGDECCVDLYFQATTQAWQSVHQQIGCADSCMAEANRVYNEALEKLIESGQRCGRFDPRRGLHIRGEDGWTFIPVEHRFALRRPIDFDRLQPMMYYRSKDLNHVYRCYALGVANVAFHCRLPDEYFRRERQAFPATAVLVPVGGSAAQSPDQFVLKLLDPHRCEHIQVDGRSIAITRDISASIADLLENRPRNYVRSFIQPGATDADTGLFMVEPYQPGKIPLVFVHGLLSDPYTWANVANEIQSQPDLTQRYQVWGYEYPTGEPFLVSAADLREQLRQVRQMFDPYGQDQSMSNMVLVGHSMGGLLVKLQVTCSGEQLWQSVSNRPLPEIVADERLKHRLRRAFKFQPSPDISRVVYMATPHRGSPWARRPIGAFGAKLVEEPAENVDEHRMMVGNNPNTFTREFRRRIPTSIDLLRSDSNLLAAIDALPVRTGVEENSIIGNFRPMIGAGPSDGIVPVSSAVRTSARSELMIRAKHVKVHQSDDGIAELMRLLRQHAATCAGN